MDIEELIPAAFVRVAGFDVVAEEQVGEMGSALNCAFVLGQVPEAIVASRNLTELVT